MWPQKDADNDIHWINLYPLDSAIGFLNTYPLYSDLCDPKKMQITISTGSISIHWIAQLVSPIFIRWIVIYPVNSAIQRFNNPGEDYNLNPLVFVLEL